LIVVAVGRQELDDFVGPARARPTDGAGRVEHRLADTKPVRAQHGAGQD